MYFLFFKKGSVMTNAATVLEHPGFERAEAPARMPAREGTKVEAAKVKGNNKLRTRLLIGLGGAIALSALAYGGYSYVIASRYVSTDNAYVGADVAQINAQITGPVAQVAVSDTKMVHKGDVLVTIDPSDSRIALASAKADYQHTLQRVSQYYAQRSQAAAQLAAQETNVTQTAEDYDRRVRLSASGAISREQLTTAHTAAEAAVANLAAAREQLNAQSELIHGYTVADHPETESARAEVAKAELQLSRTVIRAPVDGIVSQRKVQVGQSVSPGQALMTVTPIAQAYVDANFKEGQLGKVKAGQPVTLTSDLYGAHVVYHGHVAGMGGGTGSAFAIIPAQNATGNWIKVVQRVPVRIALDPKELAAHPLRVGLSMNASIDTQAE